MYAVSGGGVVGMDGCTCPASQRRRGQTEPLQRYGDCATDTQPCRPGSLEQICRWESVIAIGNKVAGAHVGSVSRSSVHGSVSVVRPRSRHVAACPDVAPLVLVVCLVAESSVRVPYKVVMMK